MAVCALLVAIAFLRVLSYRFEPGWALVGYDPHSAWNARFFKLLATPSVVAGMYFVFRALNRGHRIDLPGRVELRRALDFRPWGTRLVLTSVASLHWIVLEYAKFTVDGFYPSSPLESPLSNALVLAASQLLAFLGMKYLSFAPLSGRTSPGISRSATPPRRGRSPRRSSRG